MTAQEFIIWLQGFLEATSEIEGHHLIKIKNKLNEVNKPKQDFNKYKPLEITPYINIGTPNKDVTYGDLCSCNPKNGGSGICGCVIGNKIIEPPYNHTTTTTSTDFFVNKNILKS